MILKNYGGKPSKIQSFILNFTMNFYIILPNGAEHCNQVFPKKPPNNKFKEPLPNPANAVPANVFKCTIFCLPEYAPFLSKCSQIQTNAPSS